MRRSTERRGGVEWANGNIVEGGLPKTEKGIASAGGLQAGS